MVLVKGIRPSVLLQSLTIILSPLYILRWKIWFIPTTLLEVLILATVIVTAAEALHYGRLLDKLKNKYNYPILVLLIAALTACFFSNDFFGGLGIFRAYFIEPILFFYCLIYSSRKNGYKYILYSLLTAGLWLSILSLFQKLTGSFSLAPNEIIQGRVSGVYNSANSLALFIVPTAIISLALFLTNKGYLKIIYLILFIFYSLIVVFSKSKGGIIAESISLVVFVYSLSSLKNELMKRVWLVVPLAILITTAVFLFMTFQTYNSSSVNFNEQYIQGDTLQIRYFIWVGTASLLKDHPIFGAGLNGFKGAYAAKYRLPEYPEDFQYPHNLLLTFWAETGILGLFAFMLIIVESFSVLIRNLDKSKIPVLGAGLIAVLTYIFVHGIVDVPYFKNDLSLEFWVFMALIEIWSRFFIEKSR
ncbi:MAG: O-antigen ligase family protein [Candidatus Paceibacterales bacterium]